MRTLKTPEEILRECEVSERITYTHPARILAMIKAAQRDALECVRQNVSDNYLNKRESEDEATVSDTYYIINDLLPK